MKVLMIEDDEEFAEFLTEYLNKYNIFVTNYLDPYLGISTDLKEYECVILDLTLPGMDGLEVIGEIRKKSSIPIIVSSARSDISDRVIGLQIGADDYLPKPYDPKEMQARILSCVRRANNKIQVDSGASSAFREDERRHEITYHGKPLILTPAEYEILGYLLKQHSYSVSREQIINNCDSLRDKESKSLDVIIGRLRAKIGDSSKEPKHIFSIRGIGYKLLG